MSVTRNRAKTYGPYRHGHKWRVHVRSGDRTIYQSFDDFGEAAARVLAGRPKAPRERQKRGASWVYFVQCQDDNGYIKIGYTRDLARRLVDIQMGCPYEIVLLAEIRTSEPSLFEATLHERFGQLSVRGEWFRPAPDLLEMINSLPSRSQMIANLLGGRQASVQ